MMGRIISILRHIKESAEWYAILAGAGLLPTATFIAGVVNEAPADILLLYVMAAAAFGFVIFAELPAVMRELHQPKLVLEYSPACCITFEEKWDSETVLVGIRNRGKKTVRNVRVKVLYMRYVTTKGRTHSVAGFPTTIGSFSEIHPSDDVHTEHASLVSYGRPRHPEVDEAWVLAKPPTEIGPDDHFGKLRIEAEDSQPLDVPFRVHFTSGHAVLDIG